MTHRGTTNLYWAMVVGAGVGLLAARLMHLDIGPALVVGALVGVAGAVLEHHSRPGGGPTSGG